MSSVPSIAPCTELQAQGLPSRPEKCPTKQFFLCFKMRVAVSLEYQI